MSEIQLPSVLNVSFVEGLYEAFQRDPGAVSREWQEYFHALENGGPQPRADQRAGREGVPEGLRSSMAGRARSSQIHAFGAQDRVDQLIRVYRMRGHIIAEIDPLGRPRPIPPELDPAFYGLTEADLDFVLSRLPKQGLAVNIVVSSVEEAQRTWERCASSFA